MTLGADLYPGIPFARYIADDLGPEPSLSSGIANILLQRSPLHARHAHPRLNPKWTPKQDKIMDAGSVSHEILLGGESRIVPLDPQNYVGKKGGVPKGWTNDAIREARDQAWANGGIPVLLEDLAQINEMVETARAYLAGSEIADVFTPEGGESELTLLWQEGGIWCRARPDRVSKDRAIMVDYKTTAASAEPNAWARNHLLTEGYDVQDAHYRAGLRVLAGAEPDFVFLVQENEPPYACSLVACDPALREFSGRKLDYAMMLWKHCLATNKWNGYPPRIAWAEPPAYAVAQFEERKSVDELIELGTQA